MSRRRRARAAVATALTLGALALALVAPSAQAAFGFVPGSVSAGSTSTLAGAHSDSTTTFELNNKPVSEFEVKMEGNLKDLNVDLPPGLIGNPQAAPPCNLEEFETNKPEVFGLPEPNCAKTSQIGEASVKFATIPFNFTAGVFNLSPQFGQTALFGFRVASVSVLLAARPLPEDHYAIRTTLTDVSEAIPIQGTSVTLWGVPADHNGGGGQRIPFMTNPSSCDGAEQITAFAVDSWQEPASQLSEDAASSANSGCSQLPFQPTLTARPTTTTAGAASGLDVDLHMPQSGLLSAGARAEAALRDATVTLPTGFSLNPSSADGLGACTDAQIGLEAGSPVSCPESSKVGSLEIKTPLLNEPVLGSIYLGSQLPDDPYRIFLDAENSARGISIRLEGRLHLDSQTGQVTAAFTENPQLPFEDLRLRFKTGPRAPLSAPGTCGTYTTSYTMTSWAGQTVSGSDPTKIGENCSAVSIFNPGLEAGPTNPLGGASSPFALKVTREGAQQNISTLSVSLPDGELAKLAGVPLCTEAAAPTGACDSSSQVGTTAVAVGAGSNPLYLPQTGRAPTAVYLAGPYKGAPYSLVVKVPAQAGPFDLGTIAVRTALQVDPTTTQVTAVSDPLPQILQGIPISYRTIYVNIDRPDFTVNPTNCNPMVVGSTITSTGGSTARPQSRFQVTNCAALGFGPKLALSLKGGTSRAKNPALKAVLTQPAGQANIGKVQTILPKSVFIDSRHVNNPCTRVQFNSGAGNGSACPAKSIIGNATAYSPLLEKPLTGKVYFRSNGGERKLPDLVASLDGQIHVNLVGFIDSVKQKGSQGSRVRNTFAAVPDAPVSRFVLELQGGKKGLIQNSTNLCKSTDKATVKMDGQNGKVHDFETVVKATSCAKKSTKPKKK